MLTRMVSGPRVADGGGGRDGAQLSPHASLYFRRVLAKHCPQCGEGALFLRFARLLNSCPVCDLVYRREQGAQTGSMYLTAAVNQVFAALLIFAVFLFTDWGVALSLAVSVPAAAAFCFAFLPYSMGLWVAIEYWTDVKNREPWARPRG